MLKENGYIGSIGDDLPSLIPLLFALMMFFGIFTFTLDTFNQKKELFDREFEAMRIADTLRYNGYITRSNLSSSGSPSNPSSFDSLCASLIVSRLNYFAGLTNRFTAPERYSGSGEAPEIDFLIRGNYYSAEDEEYICTNLENPGDLQELKQKKGAEIIVKIYPVVLEESQVVKPMHLVVIVWK